MMPSTSPSSCAPRGSSPPPSGWRWRDTSSSPTTIPTADQVWSEVRRDFPVISRATVYNTLNLFAEKGLLQSHSFDDGAGVFDANTAAHHHFIDEESGRIVDIPIEHGCVCRASTNSRASTSTASGSCSRQIRRAAFERECAGHSDR